MNSLPITVDVKINMESITNLVIGGAILMLFAFILNLIYNSIKR